MHWCRFPGSPFLAGLLALFLVLSGDASAQSGQAGSGSSGEPSYGALADLLENEQSRARLIEELRGLAAESEGAATQDAAGAESTSFAGRFSSGTQAFAESVVSEFSAGARALSDLFGDDASMDLSGFMAAMGNLALIVISTAVIFLVLRRLARALFARTAAWATRDGGRSPLLRRAMAVLGAALVDVLIILAAWVGGYALALSVVGEAGALTNLESLFLNAFVMVELFKALIRVLFASRDDGLRLLPLASEDAAYWNAWLARLSGFIGYGMLLVVPAVNAELSQALGRFTALLVMAVAFLYALIIILQNRVNVGQALRARAQRARLGATRVLLGMLSRSWHVLVIGYFAVMAVVTVLRPEDALPLLLQATVQTLLAVGAGAFLAAVVGQVLGRRIQVQEETRRRFPSLEARLNGFVPMTLKVVRFIILIGVIAVILDAWGVFNLRAWLTSEAGTYTVLKSVTVAIILLAVMGLWIGLASWIEHRLNPESGRGEPSAREKTLLAIFRNAVAIALVIMTLMIVLAEIGINIGPLIAGAGVLGLAIGFGAQKLVQDVITGVFIQMENAVNAGDVITAAGVTGTAEKLTIRSLGIRDLSGTYHLIPFSSVDTVSNYMRDFAYHVGEYGVAYREDVDDVIARLREAFDELVSDTELRSQVLGELEVHGVTALADSSVNVRVRIKTLPGVQWAVGRAYNRLVKRHLDAAGIEIPFPHLTVYFGEDKDGAAPPAHLQLEQVARQTDALPETASPDKGESDVDPEKARTNPVDRGDFDDAER